jgi:hypothetical protein
MATIDLTAIVPYAVSLFVFFVGCLLTIGAYYLNRFQKELDGINAKSDARCADFYDKYEDIQRGDTEIKLILERLKTEHEMQLCKREQWK